MAGAIYGKKVLHFSRKVNVNTFFFLKPMPVTVRIACSRRRSS